jgi:predicted nucleotidyltransferase
MSTLQRLLGSKTRAALLRLFFSEPGREFYLAELFSRVPVARRAVQQEVAQLIALGLLRERRDGNRRYLGLEQTHPAFEPLRELVRRTAGLPAELRAALVRDPRIQLALLFGSTAAGLERAQSDIDVLVVGDLGLRDLLQLLAPVQQALGRPIHPVLMTAGEFNERRQRGEHFLTRVLETGPLPLVGSIDGLA